MLPAALPDALLFHLRRRALAGYDHLGGTSTWPTPLDKPHLNVSPAPNTVTSGTVSGEAWTRDPSRLSQTTMPGQ